VVAAAETAAETAPAAAAAITIVMLADLYSVLRARAQLASWRRRGEARDEAHRRLTA
jgi:hypothetical protein